MNIVIIILSVIWAGLLIFPLMTQIKRYKVADHYEPSVLKVTSVHYLCEGQGDIHTTWVMGTINGVEEKFDALDLPETPKSQEQLESMISVGKEIKVLYLPKGSQHLLSDPSLRVDRYVDNHKAFYRKMVLYYVKLIVIPIVMMVTVVQLIKRFI